MGDVGKMLARTRRNQTPADRRLCSLWAMWLACVAFVLLEVLVMLNVTVIDVMQYNAEQDETQSKTH